MTSPRPWRTPVGYVLLDDVIDQIGQLVLQQGWRGIEGEVKSKNKAQLSKAIRHLFDLCEKGTLDVYALLPDGRWVKVHEHQWRQEWFADALMKKERPVNLFVKEEQVKAHVRPLKTSASEKNARKWFLNQVKGPKTKSRDDYFREATERFGVSRRQFERLWADLAPPDWKQPGKRPIKTQQ